jgi:hypothetical protein
MSHVCPPMDFTNGHIRKVEGFPHRTFKTKVCKWDLLKGHRLKSMGGFTWTLWWESHVVLWTTRLRAASHYGRPSREALGLRGPNFVESPKK